MNTTLKTVAEIEQYITKCQEAGYVHRADKPKNWDNYKAVTHILQNHTDVDVPIMDAGGIEASAFLPSLAKRGYRRLLALDLSNPMPPKLINNITYRRGDITDTKYPNQFFQAVGCLSVIEHGVDLKQFFTEMHRILKVGGSLIVSTDYWCDKIHNPQNIRAYGVPIMIFSRQEIEQAIYIAKECGFELTEPTTADLECEEKIVSWYGFQYTFIILCFRKK
jgi:SAM-dependent methyltransferase